MISFDKINKFDPVYQFFNSGFRLAHNRFYYKQIQLIDYQNVPKKGYPLFVISNHQNAVMDPLASLYMFKDHRQPVYIARGDVFKSGGFIARLLRFLKILPTFRSRDGDREDIRFNLETFNHAARVLNEGGTVSMFPEAGHQQGKYMASFKKGFPRVAFLAAEKSGYTLDFKILPMFIYYTDYFNMRGKQVVVIGKPFDIDEFYELYKSEPNKAYAAMNEKAREAVRSLGVDVLDQEHYPQYDVIFHACHSKVLADPHAFDGMRTAGTPADRDPKQPYAMLLSDIKVEAIMEAIRENSPEEYEHLLAVAEEYGAGLKELNLRDWLFDAKTGSGALCKKVALLALTFPFFVVGAITNAAPFWSVKLLQRNLKDKLFTSTLNFVPALVFFTVWFIIVFTLLTIFTTWWIGLLTIVTSSLTIIPYAWWRRMRVKVRGMFRFHKLEKAGNPLLAKLKALREEIRNIVK